MIDHRHLFRSVASSAAGRKPLFLVPSGECHTAASDAIAERITSVYT